MPFAIMADWPGDLARLRAAGFALVALTPTAIDTVVDSVGRPFRAARVALLLGHEGSGLSAEAVGGADLRLRIPMAEGVDSLNVATAAAIALYELSRS